MSVRTGLRPSVLTVSLAGNTVLACHTCKQTPCVMTPPPAPAFECVTEMVPFTITKTKTRVDLVPVCTKTVMETKIDIVYDEQIEPSANPYTIRYSSIGVSRSAGPFVKQPWFASRTGSAGQSRQRVR